MSDGNSILERHFSSDFLHHQDINVSLGLFHNYQASTLAVSLGLPDPVAWAKDEVFAKASVQVIAYTTAAIGVVVVVRFIQSFRS